MLAIKETYMFEIKDKDLAGRIGILRTPHGRIETPYMFPVINPRKQDVAIDEIIRIGFNALITNAWLVKKYYGNNISKIHEILGHKGPIMTDSGAYQELQYGYVDVDPIEIIEYQKKIGSDIAVILDKPTPPNATLDEALSSVKTTIDRALQAIEFIENTNQLWVLPIQGAPYIKALKLALEKSMDPRLYNAYSIYAIGSPTKLLERYDYRTIVRIVAYVKSRIPPDKPVHLFGAGHPMIIPFMVALGVDLFDSASYILYARDERLMLSNGTVRLNELGYLPCTCPVCSKYTARELKEAPYRERVKLIALHNLYKIIEEIKRVKQAIREGRLWELLEEKAHSHPSLYEAFKELVKYSKYLEKMDPSFKGIVHGMFLYDYYSLKRPEILRHNERVFKRYKPRKNMIVLVPLDTRLKERLDKLYNIIGKALVGTEEYEIVFYTPFIGLVPKPLLGVYPLFQFEAPLSPSKNILSRLIKILKKFIDKAIDSNKTVVLITFRDIEWSMYIREALKSIVSKDIVLEVHDS
ncbi:MAG: tRNA guanosine(15) transglycosylase TgtA [Thermoprotei archaeon]|nr:MAG: tRNA guanosine(15) transglycosylase TgtA [Thermoprotei archaeon]